MKVETIANNFRAVFSTGTFAGSGKRKQRTRCRRRWHNQVFYQSIVSVGVCLVLFLPNFANSTGGTSSTTTTTSSTIVTSERRMSSSSSSSSDTTSSLLNSQYGTSTLEDHLRKEMIKVQILQRLGLTEKPVVDLAHKISRDLVLETLRRTETLDEVVENSGGPLLSTNRFTNAARRNTNSTNFNNEDQSYAKTSEIISFPEKGPDYNGETLLTFSFAGTNAFGLGVRVKKAHLWVKMDHRSPISKQFGHLFNPRGVTLYIFQVQGNFTNQSKSPSFVKTQDIELDLVASKAVALDELGWQKLDVTSVVQNWYNKIARHRTRHGHGAGVGAVEEQSSLKNKLTLLVDCSGCGYTIHPITFTRAPTTPTPTNSTSSGNETDSDKHNNETEQEQPRHKNSSHHHHRHHHHHYSAVVNQTTTPETLFESFPDEHLSNNKDHLNDDHLDNLSEIPFLVLETETVSPTVKRARRRALECSPRVKQCCKQRFFISFAELGWQDWIIAPRGYYANYCRGHCGGVHRTPDTFLNYHTHVMEEYRRTAAGEVELNGITPCCAPTKFAAMSLIYFGPELNIIKRDLPKMIIEECGCP